MLVTLLHIYIYLRTSPTPSAPRVQTIKGNHHFQTRLPTAQNTVQLSKINQKGSPFSLPSQMAPASFNPVSNTVCVMDASGNLGLSLVQRLLQRGYMVHAAVQNHNCNAYFLLVLSFFLPFNYLPLRLCFLPSFL